MHLRAQELAGSAVRECLCALRTRRCNVIIKTYWIDLFDNGIRAFLSIAFEANLFIAESKSLQTNKGERCSR